MRALARAIGMSAGAVGERLERLQERGVIRGFSLDVDPARASEPVPGLVVVPFKGHGFPRPDFVGEAELHLQHGKVAKVVFRAP